MDAGTRVDTEGSVPAGLGRAIRETAADIAALLTEVADTNGPVPNSQWTVGEAAAHLAQANELMADLAAGRERPTGTARPRVWPRPTRERSRRSGSVARGPWRR